MNKTFALVLALLCIAAAAIMYIVGNDNSNLSELRIFWYIPLPLAIIALIGFFKKK